MSERTENRSLAESTGIRITSLRPNPVYEARRQAKNSLPQQPSSQLVDLGVSESVKALLDELESQAPAGPSIRHNGRKLGSNW